MTRYITILPLQTCPAILATESLLLKVRKTSYNQFLAKSLDEGCLYEIFSANFHFN